MHTERNLYQNSIGIFLRNRAKNPDIYVEQQRTRNSQSNPQKREPVGGILLPDFKLYFEATVTRTTVELKNRPTGQRTRRESPEINLQGCGQFIYSQRVKNI